MVQHLRQRRTNGNIKTNALVGRSKMMMVLVMVAMVSSGLMLGSIVSSVMYTNEMNRSLPLLETLI